MSKNIRKRRHCPHCNDYVSNSTYYIHKDLYFKNGVGWRVVDNVTGTLLRENQEQESEEHTIGQSKVYCLFSLILTFLILTSLRKQFSLILTFLVHFV